jgi:hypothetical protein
MESDKMKGIRMLVIGAAVLAVAILAFITLNGWGKWIAGYINTVSLDSLPAEAQAQAGAIFAAYKLFFGGLMSQVGGYMQVAGNFIGILLGCVSLGLLSTGLIKIKNA